MHDPGSGRPAGRQTVLAGAVLLALVSLLPFAEGLVSGASFYFRDLAGEFFPFRRLAVEGLRSGRLIHWNPYVHEGTPLTLPALAYPLDLLQVLLPDERGFSLLLALHVPLAALSLMTLARGLGLGPLPAVLGGLIYAWGGFGLSALNVYRYLQALAWAPLVVLGLFRAAGGARRWMAGAALVTAVAISTTGAEVVIQAVLFGLVLAPLGRDRRAWTRAAGSLALGGGLAAVVILPMREMVAASARGEGFAVDVVLAHSVHPLTFLQVLVGGLYGDLSSLADRWWGSNFFPRGFPFFLSLYLGASVLALGWVGAFRAGSLRNRLAVLLLAGLVLSLGRWSGLGAVVEAWPALRSFRYPSKAFFTVHLSVALLAASGLDALLHGGDRRGWRRLAASALALGGLLSASPLIPALFPAAANWFLSGFFPPDHSPALRQERLGFVLRDAALGGVVAVSVGLIAFLARRGRLKARPAALAITALVAADLLRAGAGLNRMVRPAFFQLSPEMAAQAARLRSEGGRVFTCDPASSNSYRQARSLRGDRHERWTFAVLMETLAPNFNMPVRVPSAYSPDLSMLVPVNRVLPPEEADCRSLPAILARLRRAGVAHVVSLDPLDDPALAPQAVVRPARVAPLAIHLYRLGGAMPLRALEGADGRVFALHEEEDGLEVEVEAAGPARLVVRDGHAEGWSAFVNGQPAEVLPAEGRHRAVGVPAGASRVVLAYRPRAWSAGLALSLLSVAVLLLSWVGPEPLRRGGSALASGLRAARLRPIRASGPAHAQAVPRTRGLGLAAAGWLLLTLVTTAPYLWSGWRPLPGTLFTGIFYYRDDFYQYLSFAEQAMRGAFLFANKFDVRDHPPSVVNLEWWSVGLLGRLLGGPVAGYHALRLVALAGLVGGAVRMLRLAGLEGRRRAWALALFGTGGGLGWLLLWIGVPGWQVPDIAMGLYPFHQALTNAHFVVGSALLLWSVIFHLEWRAGARGRLGWLATAWVLGLSRPYDLVAFVLFALGMSALDLVQGGRHGQGRRLLELLWLAPVFSYYAFLIGAHPSFDAWHGESVDVSPPLHQYLFALAPAALLALRFGRRRPECVPNGAVPLALCVWWAGLAVLLLASRSPVAKQSAISMGTAALLLAGMVTPRRWLPPTVLALCPTSVFLVWRLFHPWPDCFAHPDYFEATGFLRTACAPRQVALAPTDLSLMIAGLTPCSVTLGHRTLTPHYVARLQEGNRFYHDAATAPAWRRQYLDRLAARFVLLPAGGAALLGPDPPYRRTLALSLLEVWQRRD